MYSGGRGRRGGSEHPDLSAFEIPAGQQVFFFWSEISISHIDEKPSCIVVNCSKLLHLFFFAFYLHHIAKFPVKIKQFGYARKNPLGPTWFQKKPS